METPTFWSKSDSLSIRQPKAVGCPRYDLVGGIKSGTTLLQTKLHQRISSSSCWNLVPGCLPRFREFLVSYLCLRQPGVLFLWLITNLTTEVIFFGNVISTPKSVFFLTDGSFTMQNARPWLLGCQKNPFTLSMRFVQPGLQDTLQ